MKRIETLLLREMALRLDPADRDEMAVPSYLHPNPAVRWIAWRRVEKVAGRLAAVCPPGNGTSRRCVLDFGCGTGVLLGEARRRAERIVGVDLVLDAARLLVETEGWDRVELLTPEQARSEVAPHSVDVIVAAEVLEHVEPLGSTLEFFHSVLRPGGRLLVSLPTENRLYRLGRRVAGFSGDYHHANAASVDRQLVASGFRRTRRRSIPLPGPFSIYWILDYESVRDLGPQSPAA